MSDINQDDIDKLLKDALEGDDSGAEAAPPPEEDRGPASQDDIDALFAAASQAAPAEAVPEAPAAAPDAPAPAVTDDLEGVANQDDIDALFSAIDGASDEQAAVETAPAEQPPEPEIPADDSHEIATNDDIDALFAAVDGASPEAGSQPEVETALEAGPADASSEAELDTVIFDDIPPGAPEDAGDSFESELAKAEAAADAEKGAGGDVEELDELLSSIASDVDAGQAQAPAADAADAALDALDLDALLKEVSQAAPPPPPPPPPKMRAAPTDINADTAVLDMSSTHISQALAQAGQETPPPPRMPMPPPPPTPASQSLPDMQPAPGARREFSVLYGAGEVDSVASQINALLSSMSEKAHGYMQAWIAADSEAKELRTRALAEERRRSTLEGEKSVLAKEIDELRTRLGELEGAKIASEESRRTLETSYQAKVRELENRVTLLSSESESLKDELTRARNQATGVDIESRRARFEADRLKNEVESERMERLRIQRALENREKEIQAMQAQSSGQASSLFIDELHRLVRRLESELDSRTSGAHDALKQLDRLEASEEMVPVVANVRAALMQAIGADDDQEDALRSLGREAAGVRGPAALAPGKSEIVSFETALATYNLAGATDIAGNLLREARATPSLLMKKIYQSPALRRPEVTGYLPDLARLLEGLRMVQESSDRARGSETAESEMFYVHMFDFLHNLVRLKLINRLNGDIWRVFLDLRGRFSFVTSDKQWAEYRDQTLNDRAAKV